MNDIVSNVNLKGQVTFSNLPVKAGEAIAYQLEGCILPVSMLVAIVVIPNLGQLCQLIINGIT